MRRLLAGSLLDQLTLRGPGRSVRITCAAGLCFLSALAFTARAAVIKEYSVFPVGLPNFITAGPDGNMWFTCAADDFIASISLDGRTLLGYGTKTAGCIPVGIAQAPTALVYTCTGLDKIGFVDPQGTGTDSPASPRPAGPVLVDGLGQLWYSSSGDAVVNYYAGATVHTGVAGASLFGIAYHSGKIYAADQAHNRIEIFDAKNSTYFGHLDTTGPPYLVTVCNGLLWYTVPSEDFIEMEGATGHKVPTIGGHVEGIACGPDGSIWYTDPGSNKIGRFRPGPDTFEEFPVPTPNATPYGIAVGPDGSVWFTENTGNQIARLFLHPPGDTNGDGTIDVSDVFFLINFLFAGGPPPVP